MVIVQAKYLNFFRLCVSLTPEIGLNVSIVLHLDPKSRTVTVTN